MGAVRIVWRWATYRRLLPPGCPCPCTGVPVGKGSVAEEWYTREEIERIFLAAKASLPMLYPFLLLGLNTGLRKGELFGLRRRDLYLSGSVPRIEVRRSYQHLPKGGKPRTVPLASPLVIEEVRAWLLLCPPTPDDLVFPLRDRQGAWRMGRSRDLVRQVRRVLTQAGVAQPAKPIHCLRHSFATLWAEDDRDLRALQLLLGHATLEMTERYAKHSPRYLPRHVAGFEITPAPPTTALAPRPAAPLLPARSVVLPDLPDLGARLLFVAERVPHDFPRNEAARYGREYARTGGGMLLSTVLAKAEAAGVPPRWLGFGEDVPGGDPDFSGRLRWLVDQHRLSGRNLAILAEIAESQASYLVRGRGPRNVPITPTTATVERLAAVLGCRPGWLAFGGEP